MIFFSGQKVENEEKTHTKVIYEVKFFSSLYIVQKTILDDQECDASESRTNFMIFLGNLFWENYLDR